MESTHERVVIARNGRPAAVLLSPEDLESPDETIAILSAPQVMKEIAEAQEAISQSDFVTIGQLTIHM